MLQVKTFVFNPLLVNCYVVDNTKEAFIIDPSCYLENEQKQLEDYIESKRLKVSMVVITHFHFDHLMGASFVASRWDLPLAAHKDYVYMAGNFDIATQSMFFGFQVKNPPKPKILLQDGDFINIGDDELKVLHVPGHSPCSIALYSKESNLLFTGDTLFEGGVGRTDLAGGDWQQLLQSIRTKLLVLPDNTQVYPGHGNSTSIQQEKLYNTFIA